VYEVGGHFVFVIGDGDNGWDRNFDDGTLFLVLKRGGALGGGFFRDGDFHFGIIQDGGRFKRQLKKQFVAVLVDLHSSIVLDGPGTKGARHGNRYGVGAAVLP
jgi:hypothetical protein